MNNTGDHATLMYAIAGVALLAILIDVLPQIGGWLLLLTVLGLLLSKKGQEVLAGQAVSFGGSGAFPGSGASGVF